MLLLRSLNKLGEVNHLRRSKAAPRMVWSNYLNVLTSRLQMEGLIKITYKNSYLTESPFSYFLYLRQIFSSQIIYTLWLANSQPVTTISVVKLNCDWLQGIQPQDHYSAWRIWLVEIVIIKMVRITKLPIKTDGGIPSASKVYYHIVKCNCWCTIQLFKAYLLNPSSVHVLYSRSMISMKIFMSWNSKPVS